MSKGTSKYDPLRDYLKANRRRPQIMMALEEIERIVGFALCESSRSPWWWANTETDRGRSQRRAWRDAGFDAYLTPSRDTVEFLRSDAAFAPGGIEWQSQRRSV